MLVSVHFAIFKYYLMLSLSLDQNNKYLAIKYFRTSIIVSIFFELCQIQIQSDLLIMTGQLDEDKNVKLINLTEMSGLASIFEIIQCLVEIVYIRFEFNNNKTKKERIAMIELFKPKFLDSDASKETKKESCKSLFIGLLFGVFALVSTYFIYNYIVFDFNYHMPEQSVSGCKKAIFGPNFYLGDYQPDLAGYNCTSCHEYYSYSLNKNDSQGICIFETC